MAHSPAGPYNQAFFAEIGAHARRSAEHIVPMLLETFSLRSVVDVGCGTGEWLHAFRRHGVTDLAGIDGDWVAAGSLDGIPLIRADLARPFALDRTFELVISLEVAEHLPASSAASFVRSLTQLGPFVLFSAAIPFQGGVDHRNEQWPEYWAALFDDCRFAAIDWLRPRVWNHPDVRWWYAQNTILYVDKRHLDVVPALKREADRTDRSRLSLVHPEMYLAKVSAADAVYGRLDPDKLCLSTLLKAAPHVAANALRRRWHTRGAPQ